VDLTVELDAPYPPEVVFPWVAELDRYPSWLDIVPRAVPDREASSPSWQVDLRGRLGPLARRKRLRMVRTELDVPRRVRFERAELDGRQHAAWVLDASVAPTGEGCRLTMALHYAGTLFAPVLERLLADEVDRSRRRLLDLLASTPHP